MCTYKCFCELLSNNDLSLEHLVKCYISRISVFYCTKIDYDEQIKEKVIEIQKYIDERLGDENV